MRNIGRATEVHAATRASPTADRFVLSRAELSDLDDFGAPRREDEGVRMKRSVVRGLYTVVEAAQLVGVGRSTMYEIVSRGEVASVRLGRKVFITRSTLEALLGFPPPAPSELEARLRSVAPPAERGDVPANRRRVVRASG
jgi:excisionase family DNA binding protein